MARVIISMPLRRAYRKSYAFTAHYNIGNSIERKIDDSSLICHNNIFVVTGPGTYFYSVYMWNPPTIFSELHRQLVW